jgi:glycosidase
MRVSIETHEITRAEQLGDKVVYQIYVKSYADSNGDGIGDLRGIRDHLGYLADLEVDVVWITPFFVSPQNCTRSSFIT